MIAINPVNTNVNDHSPYAVGPIALKNLANVIVASTIEKILATDSDVNDLK